MDEFLHYVDGNTFILNYRLPNIPVTTIDDIWDNVAHETGINMIASISDKIESLVFAEPPELGMPTKAFKWYPTIGTWAAGYVKASSAFNNPRNEWSYHHFTPYDKF